MENAHFQVLNSAKNFYFRECLNGIYSDFHAIDGDSGCEEL